MARARGGSLFRILCSVVSCCSIFFISTANDEQYLGRSRPQHVTPKSGCQQFSSMHPPMALYAIISISYRPLSTVALSSRAARSSSDNALYRLLSKTMTSLEVDPAGCSARTSLRAVLHLEKKCHEFRGFCERAYDRRERSGMSSTTNVRERCFSRRHQNTKEGGGTRR
jgi:hypothetical protein